MKKEHRPRGEKQLYYETARREFQKAGLLFTEHNGGTHWKLDGHWHFWPSHHKFWNEVSGKRGEGIEEFLKLINKKKQIDKPVSKGKVFNLEKYDKIEKEDSPLWDDRKNTPADDVESFTNADAIYELFKAVVCSDEFKTVIIGAIGKALCSKN